MVAAATLTDAPAAADETPAPKPMKITVKVSFAWSAHASMDHLVHHRELETPDDGSETLASFKQRFADAEGVPVEYVQFLWFDRPIGRCAQRVAARRERPRRRGPLARRGTPEGNPSVRLPHRRGTNSRILRARPRRRRDAPRETRPQNLNPPPFPTAPRPP